MERSTSRWRRIHTRGTKREQLGCLAAMLGNVDSAKRQDAEGSDTTPYVHKRSGIVGTGALAPHPALQSG